MSVKIEDIEKEWEIDCKIDLGNLNLISSDIPVLHSKYFKILNVIKRELRILQSQRKRLVLMKSDYYQNHMSPQQMKELGWQPNKRIIIKGDLDKWIDGDTDVIEINLKIGEFQDIKEFLDDIIQNLNRRSFLIKNMIENNKLMLGVV